MSIGLSASVFLNFILSTMHWPTLGW